MEKARKFQPLAVLNQKLKGLDVFESNENQSTLVSSRPLAGPAGLPETSTSTPKLLDPEDLITREHWQAGCLYDMCLEPSCGKRLNATNGCVNCRKCGKLFCEEHTMYQMKLSRSAQHEPVRGIWARVCETCYKSREGYNDHTGKQARASMQNLMLISIRYDEGPNINVQINSQADGRQGFSGNFSTRKAINSTHAIVGQSTARSNTSQCSQVVLYGMAE